MRFHGFSFSFFLFHIGAVRRFAKFLEDKPLTTIKAGDVRAFQFVG
jgi:hypothetical protein